MDAKTPAADDLTDTLRRIAEALERLSPRVQAAPDLAVADAFVWHPDGKRLVPVPKVNRVDMSLLRGIDRVRDVLMDNTERFAKGLPANNALLWGARGMGKSSLVKACHAAINAARAKSGPGPLKLIEIHREDIESLPELMTLLRAAKVRTIVFCDDLSFDADDTTLWTYDMEDNDMHFNFDPVKQANDWVFPMRFPATPGMPDFVAAAEAKGYAIFGITGRRFVQEAATIGNLEKVGYTAFNADNFYTKWDGPDSNKPSYVSCVAACTTVEYKAYTRKHIEDDLGYEIIANFGDQYSDLDGGYADQKYKLPNPTYFVG